MKLTSWLKTLLFLFITASYVLPAMAEEKAPTNGAVEKVAVDLEKIDFANGLFDRGLHQMALNEYQAFVKTFPKSDYLHEATFGSGESLFFLKKYKEALAEYQTYAKKFPKKDKATFVQIRLGQTQFFLENYAEAIKYLTGLKEEQLTAIDQNFQQIHHFYLAKSYRETGKNEEALAFFQKTIGLSEAGSYNSHAHLEIGHLQAEKEQFTEANASYDQAFGLSQAPEVKALAYYNKGKVAFAQSEFDEAANQFKHVFEKYTDEEVAKDALANLLLALFNVAKYDRLIVEYDKHKAKIPQNGETYNVFYIAASALSELGRYDDSLALLDSIFNFKDLKVDDKQQALLKKGEVLVKAERYGEAVNWMGKIVKHTEAQNDHVLYLKAEAYYGSGDFDQAYQYYEKVVNEFPESPFFDEASYGLAHTKNAADQFSEASELFYSYYQNGSDQEKKREALYNVIFIASKQEEIEDAISHAKTYIKEFPQEPWHADVLFLLGNLYSKLKDYASAAETFQQFLQTYPKHEKLGEVYFLLAYSYQQNNSEEAIKYYEKVTSDVAESILVYSALKNIALVHLNNNDEDQAAVIFDRILSEFDKNDLGMDTYLWLAETFLSKKRYGDVLRVVEQAKARKGKEAEIGIEYFRAEALKGMENCRQAIASYDQVLVSKEEAYISPSRLGKGECFITLQQWDQAKAVFEETIQESVDDVTVTMRARFELGNIARALNQPDEAIKFYMLVAVLYQDEYYCPEALYRAGQLFETLDKKAEAVSAYQEIIKDYEANDLLKLAQERVKVLGAK